MGWTGSQGATPDLGIHNIKNQMAVVLIECLVPCPVLRSEVQLQVKLCLCFSGRKLKNVNA